MTSPMLESSTSLFFSIISTAAENRWSNAWALTNSIILLDYSDKAVEETGYLDVYKKKIDFIRANTTKKIKIPLAVAEFVIIRDKFRYMNKNYEFKGRDVTLFDIQEGLMEALSELIIIVSDIALRNNVSLSFDLQLYKTKSAQPPAFAGRKFHA